MLMMTTLMILMIAKVGEGRVNGGKWFDFTGLRGGVGED